MDKRLKCVLLLSLKEISLRRVAALLWSGPDILASFWELVCDLYYEEKERELGDKIKDRILKLEWPDLLTNQMIELVGPMGLEVRAWLNSSQGFFWTQAYKSSLPDSAKLCWTTAGTINYRKTAEELLRCGKLDVEQCYTLACSYCLEDRISLYWEELSEEKKDTYLSNGQPLSYLPYCWPYILKGKHSELDHLTRTYSENMTSFNQYAFESSAKEGNETAAKYFFQKLSHEEREAALMRTARAVIADCERYPEDADFERYSLEPPNVLLYLLSLMTPEEQMEIIEAHPIEVFLCFLRLQLQGLFRENAGLLWALLPPSEYIYMLMQIIYGYPFIFSPKMIKELFMESPQDFKTCFIEETTHFEFLETPACDFLCAFFRYKDPESMKAVFRSVDAAIRVKLVRRNISLFYDYMLKDEWHLVELCLREAALSKEEKGRLKDDFTGFLEGRGELENPDFKRFFEFLHETDASSDQRKKGQKRKLENGSQE